jgi:hypothetical protein
VTDRSAQAPLLNTADVGGFTPTTERWLDMSREYDAVLHILTAPQISTRTARFIGPDDFDFAGLGCELETMSVGEGLLVRIAHELWLAERRAGFWELVRRLDPRNFERVLEAFRIARGSHVWEQLDTRLAA